MSAIKDLIQMLVAGNSRRIPLRNVYYKLFHTSIVKRLGKRAEKAIDSNVFIPHLAVMTWAGKVSFSVPESEKQAIIADADKSLNYIFNCYPFMKY